MSIKRRSGQSFYSFHEDDSFHGSRSFLKDIGSTPRKRKPENEVLLVSRNPLYSEQNVMTLPVISSRETTPEHKVIQSVEESCAQTEITAPVSEVKEQITQKSSRTGSDVTSSDNDKNSSTGKTNEAITPLSAKDLEEDIMKIYSSMNNENHSAPSHHPDQNQDHDHIYSSIHSEGQSSRSKQSSNQGSVYTTEPNSNFSMQKPPAKSKSVSPDINTVTNGEISDHSGTNSLTRSHKSSSSRKSGVNKQYQNGSIIPKPPIKVLSLDGLRPNCHTLEQDVNNTRNLSEGSALLVRDDSLMQHIDNDCDFCSEASSDTDSLMAITGGKSVERVRPLDMRIEDNLLTEEEYHRDVVVADLY